LPRKRPRKISAGRRARRALWKDSAGAKQALFHQGSFRPAFLEAVRGSGYSCSPLSPQLLRTSSRRISGFPGPLVPSEPSFPGPLVQRQCCLSSAGFLPNDPRFGFFGRHQREPDGCDVDQFRCFPEGMLTAIVDDPVLRLYANQGERVFDIAAVVEHESHIGNRSS
jgi:hypothetical protein